MVLSESAKKFQAYTDKIPSFILPVGVAFFIKDYNTFISNHGNFGALFLIVLLCTFLAVWGPLIKKLTLVIFSSPADKFVGTWIDFAWPEAEGVTPKPSTLINGAWIDVSVKDGDVQIDGRFFSVESLKCGMSTGRFRAKVINVSNNTLTFQYIGDDGDVLSGFGWYCLISSHSTHKLPNEWRGHFFQKGEPNLLSKARKLTRDEVCEKEILESDMAAIIRNYFSIVRP
jgi:hypothetical protein